MGLEIKINDDIKQAMLAKDKRKLEALRAIKAALLLEKTGKDTSAGEIPESVELKLLQKLVKQRKDSALIYREQNRADMAEEEEFQASIIEKYLPEQMSEAEVEAIIEKIIDQTGAKTIADMGKVMGMASKQLAGKSDNKTISILVKKHLHT
ncbi:MAG TPA: GatB/YqeY domain-containing protein [Bacteroidales bacterium]